MTAAPALHREAGRVAEVRRGRAIIELEAAAAAGERPECARCRLCSTASGAAGRVELRAAVPPELELAPGDRVEVELRLAPPGRAALLLLGLPLAAFLAASGAIWALSGSEDAAAVAGFVALAAAYLVLAAVERRRGPRARVARRLSGAPQSAAGPRPPESSPPPPGNRQDG